MVWSFGVVLEKQSKEDIDLKVNALVMINQDDR